LTSWARSNADMVTARGYKIFKLLPSDGSDLMYRIKSASETFERVAKERELAQRSHPL